MTPTRTARIDKLTDEHRATFPDWVTQWTAVGLRTGQLTEAEWQTVEAAYRRAYQFAKLPDPVIVHGATSPLAACIAAHVAARVAPAARAHFSSSKSGVGSGVWSGVQSGVWSGVQSGVRSGVGSGVWSGVGSGVRSGVGSGVWSGVGSGVWSGVGSGVRSGVRSGVGSGVGSGVQSGVRSGVRSGVGSLEPYQEWLHEPIQQGLKDAGGTWYDQYYGGNLWCSWEAFASWFRDVGELDLPGDLWDRLQCSIDMTAAGPSWLYSGFAVVSDRPVTLHVERFGEENRLHCEDGPAMAWADGWGLYYWHGTAVPQDLIDGPGWDTTRILQEPNAEIRRCAIERMGWDQFAAAARLKQVGPVVDDPGNPGQTITLYDVPERIYGDEDVRVLLCTNGTVERDGTRRRFGLTVPANVAGPIEAAAWGYTDDDHPVRMTPDLYRQLASRH